MFEGVWAVFDQTTLVDVSSPGYVGVYNILFGVAVFFMLGFFPVSYTHLDVYKRQLPH